MRHLRLCPASCVHLWVALLSLMIGLTPVQVAALPSGGVVQGGSAQIQDSGPGSLNIAQQSERAIIDWINFNIQPDEQVNFDMPSASSINLSRVTGGQVSEIFGKLTSNGQLFLVNPNGILFGQGSQVDVSGLVATTSGISNADFMAGNYNFNIASPSQSRIINRGNITVRQGGLAAFVAPGVENSGIISATLGRVSLASGKTFALDLYGDELVSLGLDSRITEQVLGPDGEALSSLIGNSGQIFADGGRVTMSVNAARDVVDHAINMSGLVQARSIGEKNGEIYLMGGETGTVNVTGTLDASGYGEGETGGVIHVLGDRVFLDDYGFIDISGDAGGGRLLFGGDYQGNGTVQNATDTYVGGDARIWADAVNTGNGGRAIFWADRRNYFLGRVRSRGGLISGDGGFVEVSGKETLFFNGYVDTTAQNGETGMLLLDPGDITIAESNGEPDDVELPDISASGAVSFTISELALETQSSTTNINLFAEQNITVEDLIDNLLNLQQTAGRRVTLTAKNGNIFFQDGNDEIRTQGGNITLKAGGDMTLGKLNAGAGTVSIFGNDEGTISLGTDTSGDIHLENSELAGITAANLVIGGANATEGRARFINVNGVGAVFNTGLVTLRALSPEKIISGIPPVTFAPGSVNFGNANSSFFNTGLSVQALGEIKTSANTSLTAGQNLALTGDVNLAAGSILTSTAGSLTLDGTVDGITGAGSLTLNGNSGVFLNDDVTANGALNLMGNVTLQGPANQITSTGNMTFSGSVSSIGSGLQLNAGANTISIGGNSLSALSGITLNSDTNFTGAVPLTINAATSGVGGFTVATGKVLNTMGEDVSVTASDLILNGNLNAGAGMAAFNASAAGGIDLALASTGKLFRLDTSELARITAGSLGVDAGTGTLVVNGVDRTTHLANIAGGVTLGGGLVQFTGAGSTFNSLTVNGPASIAGINLSTNNGNMVFNNALTLSTNAVQLSTGAGAGDLSLLGTVDGAQMLTLDSGTGAVTLGGNVGTGTALSSLDVSGDTTINGSSITTNNGNITFNDNVTLGNTVNIHTGAGGGNAVFSGTVDATTAGVQGLTVNTGTGTSSFQGNVGTGTALGSLSVTGNSTINGDVTAQNGNVSFNNNLTLGAGSTIASGNGNINLNAVDGSQTLSLNAGTGTVNLDGNIGSGAALTSLDVTGDAVLSGITITTANGNVTFNDQITLDTAATSIHTGAGGGNISLQAVDGARDLALDSGTGTIGLNGAVGGTTRLNSLTTTGTTTISGSTLSTNNGITFDGNVTASSGLSIDADADNTGAGDFVQQSGTLNTNNNALSIRAQDITLAGGTNSGTATTTIIASQGQNLSLGDATGGLELDNADLANISTTGGFIFGDGTGSITANNVNNTLSTTLNGSTVLFNGAASSFGSLLVNGAATIDGIDVSTMDAPLTFSNNLTLMNGPIQLSTGAGPGDLSLLGNIDGGVDLTLSSGTGSVIFGGAVGSSTRLNSLTVNGTTTFNGPSLFTNNGITFNGNVNATAHFALNADADNNGSGTFNQLSGMFSTGGNNLSITADDINLASTVNAGAGTVTVIASNGKAISLGDAMGGLRLSNTDLANITSGGFVFGNGSSAITVNNVTNLASTTLNGTSVTFSGADSSFQGLAVNGATTIAGVNVSTPGAQSMVFNSMLTLTTGAVQLTTVGGNITFASTVDGAQALTINPGTGTTTFGGSIGNTTALASLSLTGNTQMNGASIAVNDGLTNNGNFTRNGALAINTDADADGNGDFNHDGGTFSTTNGNLNLTTDDVVLGGTGLVNTGAGTMSVQAADNGTFGLGAANCGGACGVTLSGAELQNITSARLSAGSSTGGAVFVDGVSAANSAGLGQVDIVSGGTATFDNQSTFKNLDVAADDIAVNDVLSAGTGTLTVRTSDGGTLGVGSATGDMTLDADELGRLRAGTLNVGDSATGDLTLGNVTLDGAKITQGFNASTGGALSLQGALVSPVNTTLRSSGAGQGIVLNNSGHFFGGTLGLFTGSGGSVSISNLSNGGQALRLGNSSIGGGFSVNASTAIHFTGGVNANGTVNVANTSSGGILFDDGAFLNSGSGTLRLQTPGSLTLGRLISASSASNAIQLQVGGSVIDGGDTGGEDIVAATGGLVVRTGNGFGTEDNPIEIRVASLDLINSAGDISFFETDDIDIVRLVQEGEGNIFGSYNGMLTGEDNIEIMQGLFFITNRLNGVTLSQELGDTGKDRNALAVERTINNLIDFEFANGSNRFDLQVVDASPAGWIRQAGPAGGLFFHRLFDERFALVDVKDGNPKDGDQAHLENVWHWSQPLDQIEKEKPQAKKEKKVARKTVKKKPVAKKTRSKKSQPAKKKKDEGFLSFFKKAGEVLSFK